MKIFTKNIAGYFLMGLASFALLGAGAVGSYAVNQYVHKTSGESFESISSGRSSNALVPSMEIAADMIAWEPLPVTEFRIQSIERATGNDDDKIILRTSINGTNEHSNVIVRDKLEIIEGVVRPGMILEYTGWLNDDVRVLRVDFKDEFRFLDANGNVVIDRKISTRGADQEQIPLIMHGDPTLVTINENLDDCMEGQFEVCHPRLYFETYRDGNLIDAEVPRGVPIDIFSDKEKTTIVSDAHTYGEYRDDRHYDYVRIEFLTLYPDGNPSNILDTFAPADFPIHRFCTSFFEPNESTQGYSVEYTCTKKGERIIRKEKRKAFWKNLILKIRGEKDYGYVVC